MLMVGLKVINKNPEKYRCNPTVMPFVGSLTPPIDPIENFSYCVQKMNSNYSDYLLKPVYGLAQMGNTAIEQINGSMQDLGQFANMFRGSTGDKMASFYGIFQNFMIAISQMFIGMKNVLYKLSAIITVLMYMGKSLFYTGAGIVNGPISFLACFDPDTPIKMKSGKDVMMKDIKLGEILENGSEVLGILRLKAEENNPFYKIWSEKLNCNINVTGSHYFQHPKTKKFIKVSDYENAVKSNDVSLYYSCLITDDHLIPIGEHTFWDWEDEDLE